MALVRIHMPLSRRCDYVTCPNTDAVSAKKKQGLNMSAEVIESRYRWLHCNTIEYPYLMNPAPFVQVTIGTVSAPIVASNLLKSITPATVHAWPPLIDSGLPTVAWLSTCRTVRKILNVEQKRPTSIGRCISWVPLSIWDSIVDVANLNRWRSWS